MGMKMTGISVSRCLMVGGLLIAFASGSLSHSAFAQVPTSVDPSKLEQRFQNMPAANPSVGIQTPSNIESPALSKEALDRLASLRFTLKKVAIEGSTVYSAKDLAFAYDGMVGKQISMIDAQAIAKKITDFYRKNNYILSQARVPAQNAANGILKVVVIEGYIGNVLLEGDIKDTAGRDIVKSFAEKITKQRPIKITDLERYLLLMDDLPGATVKGLVRPSTSKVGAADLVVSFTHKTYDASYTLDNRGSKFVGPYQHSATVAANSILGMYDRTVLRLITTTPTEELRFVDLQHEEQIDDEGTRVNLTASHSRSIPGDALKNLNVRSNSEFYQARLLHPFVRSRQENLVGRFIVDARNSDTDVSYTLPLSRDRLRSARIGGSYDFADNLLGVNLLDAQVSRGLNILNATNPGRVPSRTNVEADYTKINLDLARTQALPSNFSLFTVASGQYALDRLFPAEQFSLGGANFGQGYDPAELSGDHGVAAKLELRYGQALNDPLLQNYQLYAYYDIGRVWDRKSGLNGNDKKSLASFGPGVRTNFSENLSGDLQVAFPLTKTPNNQGGHGDDGRIFFSVTGRF